MRTIPKVELPGLKKHLVDIYVAAVDVAVNQEPNYTTSTTQIKISRQSVVIVNINRLEENMWRMQINLDFRGSVFTGESVIGSKPEMLIKDVVIALLLSQNT